jgi:hypothetical protein
MRDAFVVRGFERLRNLTRVMERGVERQRTLEILALHQFHHQVIRTDVVELADIGMIQRGDDPRLTLEALRKFRGGDFDRDIAIQPRVAGAVNLAHPSRSEGRENLIGSQASSRCKGHG